MIATHFKNLPIYLCHHLRQAKHRLCIAVCWFSHRDIFKVLLERLDRGVEIELLLEYDTQNFRDGGLDFQLFIKAGGQLYASCEAGLMHHKFVIIDDHLLLTGSFNWTYNTNSENLLIITDSTTVTDFQQEFGQQKAEAKRIFELHRTELKVFGSFRLFENTRFALSDLRKKVSLGVNVWLIRMDKLYLERSSFFHKSLLPFDSTQILAAYWINYRVWDENLFANERKLLKTAGNENKMHDLVAGHDECVPAIWYWRRNKSSNFGEWA